MTLRRSSLLHENMTVKLFLLKKDPTIKEAY